MTARIPRRLSCVTLAMVSLLSAISCSHSTTTMPSAGPATRETLPQQRQEESSVTAAEDLMREHGVLRRLLMVYEDSPCDWRPNDSSRPKSSPAHQA